MASDPTYARYLQTLTAQNEFVLNAKTGSYGFNPKPGNPEGVKPVTERVYYALRALYGLYITLDLREYRKLAGNESLTLTGAVVEEAVPALMGVTLPDGTALELSEGEYRFVESFFTASIRFSANRSNGSRGRKSGKTHIEKVAQRTDKVAA